MVECEKFITLKIQDGGHRHLENRYTTIISVKCHEIFDENQITKTRNFKIR